MTEVGVKAKLKVLIVDDERFVRFTLSAILRSAGYEVADAGSSEEGLNKLKRDQFHVIVTDVMMGAIDGFMFRDGIRDFNKTIPIIFLTSLVNEDDRLMKQVMEDIHSYYLSKNAGRETILKVLAHATNIYRSEQSLARLTERIERNMELASLVQKSVLPKWTHIEKAYSYGDFWKPLGKISGDLVEWIPLSPDSCLIIFGDISGHGTHSALAMMAVQVFLKQLTNSLSVKMLRPYQIMQELNKFFSQNMGDVAYMAGLVAFFDFKKNEVYYHNAGYQDLYCFRASTGERIDLNPERKGSLPVGMLPDIKCTADDDVRMTFPDDAVFMTYSDGILDLAEDAEGEILVPQDLLEKTMSELATECAHGKHVSELATELYQSLISCGYAHQQDDIFAFAIAKPQGPEEVFAAEVKPDAVSVDLVAQDASSWTREHFGSEVLGLKVELLLEEHLLNVISHGLDDNSRRHENLAVFISKVPDQGLLSVTILDHGKPWDFTRKVKETDLDRHLDDQNAKLASHGRGMAIKRKLVSNVRYRRLADLNRNTFYVQIDADAPANEVEAAKE